MQHKEFRVSKITSIIGAIVGLIIIPVAVYNRRHVFNKRVDLKTDDVAILWENLLKFKAALDYILCLILLLGALVPPDSTYCVFLGFLYQYEEIMTLILIFRMVYHPFCFLLKMEDMSQTRIYFRRTLLYAIAGATLICVPLAALADFGRSGALCWLKSVPMQFYVFFSFVCFCWIFTLGILVRVCFVADQRYVGRIESVYHGTFYKKIVISLMLHFCFLGLVAVYSYVFRLASRAYLWTHDKEDPILSFLEIFSIACRGPVDAGVYLPKDGLLWLYNRYLKKQVVSTLEVESGHDEQAEAVRLTLVGKAYRLPFFTDPPKKKMEEKKIFISTYNMAECSLKQLGDLAGWIPHGMDVYVIGVQECMIFDALGDALLAHVGGPTKYVLYKTAIGSTLPPYHGMIGLYILAPVEDLQACHFLLHTSKNNETARGTNIGFGLAENKGGTGMAFRYFDMTFGFINCHLASDLRGRSRLGKRNADARKVTFETNLWREQYLFDSMYKHHVCVILGDLNYRLRRNNAGEVLEDVAQICVKERDERCNGDVHWRERRYASILGSGKKDSTTTDAAASSVLRPLGPLQELESCEVDMEDEEDEERFDSLTRKRHNRSMLSIRNLTFRIQSIMGAPTQTTSFLSNTSNVSRLEEPEEEEEERTLEKRVSFKALSRNFSTKTHHLKNLLSTEMGNMLRSTQQSSRRSLEKQNALVGMRGKGVAFAEATLSEGPAAGKRASTWSELLEADELRMAMKGGEVFHNFAEAEIRFPPSYRRVKGRRGYCGDYTDAEKLKTAYSIKVKDKFGFHKAFERSRRLPVALSRLATSLLQSQPGPCPQHPSVEGCGPSTPGRTTLQDRGNTDASFLNVEDNGRSHHQEHELTSGRIPSWTDRILLHIFPDYKDRISLGTYELCDALEASDHRPVSSCITAQVNVGIRGLRSFETGEGRGSSSSRKDARTASIPRDVVCSFDAGFYLVELTNVSVEFETMAPGGEGANDTLRKTEAPRDIAHCLVVFPLDNSDVYTALRRPCVVASVAAQFAFLTSEVHRNPFSNIMLISYGAIRKTGLTMVASSRPEYGGLHLVFSLRDDDDGKLASCLIPLTDSSQTPLSEQKGAHFHLTLGAGLIGVLHCDIKFTQLVLDGSSMSLLS